MNIDAIRNELEVKAAAATQEFLTRHFNGRDGGACGFAWVDIYPAHKGNTKLGKQERLIFTALGARPDWSGKVYQIRNPSKNSCQSVDAKFAGAVVAAAVLKQHGFNVSAADRLD
jgi:hypothetical protein